MLSRLIREPEEREENERGQDEEPPVYLEVHHAEGVGPPKYGGDEYDAAEIRVRVRPGDPGEDSVLDVDCEGPGGKWKSEYLDATETHEADVTRAVQVVAGLNKTLEIPAMPVEQQDRLG